MMQPGMWMNTGLLFINSEKLEFILDEQSVVSEWWKVWAGFGALFIALGALVARVVGWESSVMNRLEADEKATILINNRLIHLETVCAQCPIAEMESCVAVLKSKTHGLEIQQQNSEKQLAEIKHSLDALHQKIDSFHNLFYTNRQ